MSQITTTYETEQLAIAIAEDKARGIGCPVSAEDLRILADVSRSGCEVTLHITDRTFESVLADIKGLRDYHWNKGALIPDGRRLHSDDASLSRITASITAGNELASNNGPFSMEWGLKGDDNIVVDLPTLKQLGLLLFQHIQAVRSRYGILRGMISETSTTEQLDAVAAIMQEGWPP